MATKPMLFSQGARAAWLLAGLEFLFSLGWVVYVVFLPELLTRGGVDRRYLPWILAADQLVFALADWSMGVAIDRARLTLRRIGPLLVAASSASAMTMLLLPWLAEMPGLFLLVTTIWVASSSALRAPPYVLLSRYSGRATTPRLAGIQLLGLAAASASAPYLALFLKGMAPELPFAVSASAVGLSALALVIIERDAPSPEPIAATATRTGAIAGAQWTSLLLLALLLALGQQVHTAINSAAQFRRLADPAELPGLLPAFWIGFSVGVWLVGRLLHYTGALGVLRWACVVGALALASAAVATSLSVLLLAQIGAGVCWALMLCASIGVAAERGYPIQTGRNTGALLATLAVAAMSRLGLSILGIEGVFDWLPAVIWLVVAAWLWVFQRA